MITPQREFLNSFLPFLTYQTLVFALIVACGCEKPTGTNPEDNDLNLPACRFIYIGGCKHTWCRASHSGGLQIFDPECRPVNANVSDRPLEDFQCLHPACPTQTP